MRKRSKRLVQRSWAGICCFGCWQLQLLWPGVVVRKWLNISCKESDFIADTDDEDENNTDFEPENALPRLRRCNSETFRAEYISKKEIRICVGTWNAGGRIPPDDLDIEDWLDISEPADIYVLGFQEIVPLNAGNIFGAEDSHPVPRWESIIRETLGRTQTMKTNFKCYSDPPSPPRFMPSDDVPYIGDETSAESDSDADEGIHPVNDELTNTDAVHSDYLEKSIPGMPPGHDLYSLFSSAKRLDRLNCFQKEDYTGNSEASVAQNSSKSTFSGSERIGLSRADRASEQERPEILKSIKSSKSFNSFNAYNSFMSAVNKNRASEIAILADIDLKELTEKKRKSPFVRIVSKQMVGIFLTIWVRKGLRRHIQNVRLSTVGVGALGYIGNKGSISVSMSIYQTRFCFLCTHLTSGEKDGDELKRNADVFEIIRRTQFCSVPIIGHPQRIQDHEIEEFMPTKFHEPGTTSAAESRRIIWLGDLNYRINLPYEKTHELISKEDWSKLVEKDQLVGELQKDGAFEGWSEGTLKFPPTYKYEFNSEKYCGEDMKAGRRTPAWCDRILSYGSGMRQLSYRRSDIRLSDHRPVSAGFMAEVEAFSPRKLQRAFTLRDAEFEDDYLNRNMEFDP